MKVKFNNKNKFVQLTKCVIYRNKVAMSGPDLTENLSGFKLYEDDEETLVRDCSTYIYKWNIYTERKNGIVLTESETDRERIPNLSADPPQEVITPLSNEELTECIADLMYTESLRGLGL